MRMYRPVWFLSVLLGMMCHQAHAQLDQAAFERLHADLQPDASETWRQIPWKISVLGAQRSAAAEGKPIFIWAMDGHPLGCT